MHLLKTIWLFFVISCSRCSSKRVPKCTGNFDANCTQMLGEGKKFLPHGTEIKINNNDTADKSDEYDESSFAQQDLSLQSKQNEDFENIKEDTPEILAIEEESQSIEVPENEVNVKNDKSVINVYNKNFIFNFIINNNSNAKLKPTSIPIVVIDFLSTLQPINTVTNEEETTNAITSITQTELLSTNTEQNVLITSEQFSENLGQNSILMSQVAHGNEPMQGNSLNNKNQPLDIKILPPPPPLISIQDIPKKPEFEEHKEPSFTPSYLIDININPPPDLQIPPPPPYENIISDSLGKTEPTELSKPSGGQGDFLDRVNFNTNPTLDFQMPPSSFVANDNVEDNEIIVHILKKLGLIDNSAKSLTQENLLDHINFNENQPLGVKMPQPLVLNDEDEKIISSILRKTGLVDVSEKASPSKSDLLVNIKARENESPYLKTSPTPLALNDKDEKIISSILKKIGLAGNRYETGPNIYKNNPKEKFIFDNVKRQKRDRWNKELLLDKIKKRNVKQRFYRLISNGKNTHPLSEVELKQRIYQFANSGLISKLRKAIKFMKRFQSQRTSKLKEKITISPDKLKKTSDEMIKKLLNNHGHLNLKKELT